MIRCVAFDFDGTLVKSNAIKRDGFFAVTAHIPGADRDLNDLFAAGYTGDRYALLAELSLRNAIGQPKALPFDAKLLADAYSDLCHEKILACDEVPGTSETLAYLEGCSIPSYVVSATPVQDLKLIVAERRFGKYFASVYGRPGDKPSHLKEILLRECLEPHELVMVGDGADDQAAAEEVGCRFAAMMNSGNQNPLDGHGRVDCRIEDLCALPQFIRDLGHA